MLKENTKNYISSKQFPLLHNISSSGDMAWLLGFERNKRERDEDIIETNQYYVITFRKVAGKWKEVAVCIA